MSKIDSINAELARVNHNHAHSSQANHAEWNRLQEKYNLSSFELEHFFATAHSIGYWSAERMRLWSALSEATQKKSFWKKLFRK